MNPLFQLVADQFTPQADDPAAGIAAPPALRSFFVETTRFGGMLRPLTLSQRTFEAFRGKDPANQPQATRGLIQLLERRPALAAAAAVDPAALAAAADKDDTYDLVANVIGQVQSRVQDGQLACRAAQRDAAERLVVAIKQRHAELAGDPMAQTELLARFGALDINARIIEERDADRRQRNERRDRDASAAAEEARGAAQDEAAVAHLLGDTRGKQG